MKMAPEVTPTKGSSLEPLFPPRTHSLCQERKPPSSQRLLP